MDENGYAVAASAAAVNPEIRLVGKKKLVEGEMRAFEVELRGL